MKRLMFFTLIGLALFHWGASIAVMLNPCHIPWLHFSSVAAVLTIAAASILPKKG